MYAERGLDLFLPRFERESSKIIERRSNSRPARDDLMENDGRQVSKADRAAHERHRHLLGVSDVLKRHSLTGFKAPPPAPGPRNRPYDRAARSIARSVHHALIVP